MTYITGTTADIVEAQKSARSSLYGGKKWEEYFLQPTQQYYQAAGEAVQQQTAYDISQAYANYKQQELALLQQQQLGTGFKEQQASALKGQYGQTYSGLKSTELQNLMNIESQYQSTLAEEEERLAKRSALYQTGSAFTQDFIMENLKYVPGFEDVTDIDQLYDVSVVDGMEVKTLNERGKLAYERILAGGDITLLDEKGDVLYDDKGKAITKNFYKELYDSENKELIELYESDPEMFKQVIGGLEYRDVDFEDEKQQKASELKTFDINEEKELELSDKYDYDKTKTPEFTSQADKQRYLNVYESHAKGNFNSIAKENRDDVKQNLSQLFGGETDKWRFDEGSGGASGLIVSYEGDVSDINWDEFRQLAKKLNLRIVFEDTTSDYIAFGIGRTINAQELAKAVSVLTGALKI